jgi:serine/threonine protein kinase
MLKICDLGSASDASENEITPYLVSRFYRAPEIILGMQYDFAIDIWSIGCTLYEMYTGKILFTGRTNNQMLRSIMDCRGKFTIKMLKRAKLAHIHFDEMANFRSVEQEKLTGKVCVYFRFFYRYSGQCLVAAVPPLQHPTFPVRASSRPQYRMSILRHTIIDTKYLLTSYLTLGHHQDPYIR